MAAMKDLAIGLTNLGIDVSGAVTLADVLSPAPGETPAERRTRLAAKAVIEGCRIADLGRCRYAVTSSRDADTVYLVDAFEVVCACEARGYCKHLALAETLVAMPDGPVSCAAA